MNLDDRLRRELQKAIPSDPPPDPGALADELIRRASSGGGGGSGRRVAVWTAAVILGGSIGGALGFSGLFDSKPEATVVIITSTTTTFPARTTLTIPTITVPEATVPEVTVPEVTVPEVTVPEVTVPDTSAPTIGQQATSPNPIWELDSEMIPCGTKPREATVTAQVSDDRGVASVTLSWQFQSGAGGSKAMSGSGTYSATFGPFSYLTVADNVSEPVTLTITAGDAAGNTSAALTEVTVVSTSTCFG